MASAATSVVKVLNGQTEFGNGKIQIVKDQAGQPRISQDIQFLLLVLLMGAFGSCVYGLKTLADYIGEGTFASSWFCYYLVQPFEGAGIALILYLAIRGGFLTGAGDNTAVNKFGICTIAALAGAFSDTAFMKLREVFLTLFRPQDDRSGKMDGKLQITTSSLPVWNSSNDSYNETLKASGGAGSYKWSVVRPAAMPGGLALDASGKVTGAKGTGAPGYFAVEFSVSDGKDVATRDLTVTVK